MNKFKHVLSVLVLALAINGCKKDDVVPATPIDLLTGGTQKTWVIVSSKIDGVADLEDCNKDDESTFIKATSKVNYTVGAKKCDATDVDMSDSFTLSADGKTLTLGGFGFTVTNLTEKNLDVTLTLFGVKIEESFQAK